MNFEDSQCSDVNEIDIKNTENNISSGTKASSSISTTPEPFSSDEWTLSSGSEESSLSDTTIDITILLDNLPETDVSKRSQISRTHLESESDASLDSRNEEHCSEASDIFPSTLHLKPRNHGLTNSWISTTPESPAMPFIDFGLSDGELSNDKLNGPQTYSTCNEQADDTLKMFQCFGTITRQDANLVNTSTNTHLAKGHLSEMKKDDYESSASFYVTTKDVETPATETKTQVSVVDPLEAFMDVNTYNETEFELISTPDFNPVEFKSNITSSDDSSTEIFFSDDTKDSSKKGSDSPTFSGVSTSLNSSDEVKIVHSKSFEDDPIYKELSDYLDETSSSNATSFSNEVDLRTTDTHVLLTEIKENRELNETNIRCESFSEVSNTYDSNKCDKFTRSLEGDADTVKMETKESELNEEYLDDLIMYDSNDSDELPDSVNCRLEPDPFICFSQDSKTPDNKTLLEATKNTSHLELSFTTDTLREEKELLDLCESKLLDDIQKISSKRIQSNYKCEDPSSKKLLGIYETKYDVGGHANSSIKSHFSKTKSLFGLEPMGKNTIRNKLDPIEKIAIPNIEKPRVPEMKDFVFYEKLSKSCCFEIENKLVDGNFRESADTDNDDVNEISNEMASETSQEKIPYFEDVLVNEWDNNKPIPSTFIESESSNEFCFKDNSTNCAEKRSGNYLEDINAKQSGFSTDMNMTGVSIPCQFQYSVDSSKTRVSSTSHQGDQRIKRYMQYFGKSNAEKNESERIMRVTETCETITNKEIKKSVFEHIKLNEIVAEERGDKEIKEVRDEISGNIGAFMKDPIREHTRLKSNSKTLTKLKPCKVVVQPLNSKLLKSGMVLESSEVTTSPMDMNDGEINTLQNAFNMDVQYPALQELIEFDKAIAKGVIKALSDLNIKKGANCSQIRKFLTQRKLVRVHSKLNNDIQRFLKSAEEVGIVKKTGLKYQLQSKVICSKQKFVSRTRGVAVKVRTPTSRRLEAFRKKASNTPTRFTQHLKNKSIKIPPGTPKRNVNNQNGARVFKKLRSRVVMLRNNF